MSDTRVEKARKWLKESSTFDMRWRNAHPDSELSRDEQLARLLAAYAEAENAELRRLRDFWNAQSEWSQATFGTDAERGPIGPLKHLAKEAVEAQEKTDDIVEFADCLFLVFDATRRAGFTLEQLTDACWKKLAINKARVWPKTTDMNAAVEHQRAATEGK